MNQEDKKRFARYRPGYKEPPPTQEDEKDEHNDTNKRTNKDTLGFVEKIEIDPNDLINQIINEVEQKKQTLKNIME
jgi:hypothetical protein